MLMKQIDQNCPLLTSWVPNREQCSEANVGHLFDITKLSIIKNDFLFRLQRGNIGIPCPGCMANRCLNCPWAFVMLILSN